MDLLVDLHTNTRNVIEFVFWFQRRVSHIVYRVMICQNIVRVQ